MVIEEWLNGSKLGVDIWKNKYQYNNESFEEWLDRVSGKNEDLKQLIKSKKFLFGGRALSNRGTDNKSSNFNCYSRGFVQDNLNDILQVNTDIALTYKAQGGQGISLSKLRPKGSPIGDRYTSDGIIPFMKMYNETTSTISQGGSRKGALMISLDAWHKEAKDFITIKSNDTEIKKANLSLEIDNEFMRYVIDDRETGNVTYVDVTRYYGKNKEHKIVYQVCPTHLFKLICQMSYDWADPAMLFVDMFRYYNLMEMVDGYEIETCNPCGEQPLPKNFSCNLGSLNLYEYVKNKFSNKAYFDFEEFEKDVYIAVKGLDDIIDENAEKHALKEQSENSKNYRNIGLGVFAYADMLMALGLTYGSEKALQKTEEIFFKLFRYSVFASNRLAKEKCSFMKYTQDVLKSQIIRNHFSDKEIENLSLYGLRNCSLISVAPTGSIATMFERSGGCEPLFAIKHKRKTESLHKDKDVYYDVFCKTAQEYVDLTQYDELPKYFISSQEINYLDRVKSQAAMQRHIDTAISSTDNLPNSATVEDIED